MSSGGTLDPTEALARKRLQTFLGELVVTDVPGTSGRHDFGPVDGSGRLAVEVTSDPDVARRAQRAALRATAPLDLGTSRAWHLQLYPRTRVRDLVSSTALRDLLVRCERLGVTSLPTVAAGLPLHTVIALDDAMAAVGIEYASSVPATGPPRVRLSGASSAAWGGQGPRVDTWWAGVRDDRVITGKVAKLRRSGATRTHLYSEHGLAISVGLDSALDPGAAPYALPTVSPPDGVTDRWVWPDAPGDGLHFGPGSGWARVGTDGTVRPA